MLLNVNNINMEENEFISMYSTKKKFEKIHLIFVFIVIIQAVVILTE